MLMHKESEQVGRYRNLQRAVRHEAQNPDDAVRDHLLQTVVGQDQAIFALTGALTRSRYGFRGTAPDRPQGTFLFLGPTGVGKTKTVKELAIALHPDRPYDHFLKVDCSLFSQGHEVNALIGAPPAYQGREVRPLLDPDIIESKNSVVLFDEIEKGTPELWNLLLQVMEDGEITLLNSGKRLSFKDATVIMTSNVGASQMLERLQGRRIGFKPEGQTPPSQEELLHLVKGQLERMFKPEFLNRIDDTIVFKPLERPAIETILKKMHDRVNQTEYLAQALDVSLHPSALDLLMQEGYSLANGARYMEHAYLRLLQAPLADMLASGGIPKLSQVEAYVQNGQLAFRYRPARELFADKDVPSYAAVNEEVWVRPEVKHCPFHPSCDERCGDYPYCNPNYPDLPQKKARNWGHIF